MAGYGWFFGFMRSEVILLLHGWSLPDGCNRLSCQASLSLFIFEDWGFEERDFPEGQGETGEWRRNCFHDGCMHGPLHLVGLLIGSGTEFL